MAKSSLCSAFTAVNLTDPGEEALPVDAAFRPAQEYEAVLWQKGVSETLAADADGFVRITLDCGEGVFVELRKKESK